MKNLKLIVLLMVLLACIATQVNAQVTVGGCTTADPCSGITCPEGTVCINGTCVCDDVTACNYQEDGVCVFADASNCLDCNNETTCLANETCVDGQCVVEACSDDCGEGVLIADSGLNITSTVAEFQTYITENYPQYGEGCTITFELDGWRDSRTVNLSEIAIIPLQLKSIDFCGADIDFDPPLVGNQDLTALINQEVANSGLNYDCIIESFVVDSDALTVTFSVCGNNFNSTSGQLVYQSDGATSTTGFSLNQNEEVTKTRTFTIDVDCNLVEI